MTSFANFRRYLGYSAAELASSPYAEFFNPHLAPLAKHVREALAVGAVASELLPPISEVSELHNEGYWPLETAFTFAPDGAAHIAVLTEMPGVTPAMWDWWFAWHGSEAQRYKLWHPHAHVDVGWQDGRDDLDYYIGRTSNVVEYVGAQLFKVNISFVAPSSIGLSEERLEANGETAICARIGMLLGGVPIKSGWLVHQVRPVEGGAEMRSRFWLGGSNVRLFGMPEERGALLGQMASRLQPISSAQVAELMVHDAQEMGHLAGFLPELYDRFGTAKKGTSK